MRDLLAVAVLAVLSEQPRHPYEIEQVLRERRKDFAAGKPRALYHAVDRLARKGSIEPVETSREGKRPERTVYRLTDEGRDELESWLAELLSIPITEYPLFTAAVGFLGYLASDKVVMALQARVVSLEGDIAGINAALTVLQHQMHLPRLVVLEHEYTRALRQAELDWVYSLIEDIQAGRLAWDKDALDRLFDEHIASVGSSRDGRPSGPGPTGTATGHRQPEET